MKVLDLQCSSEHLFEGWFASEDEFQRQLETQLLQCPVCGSSSVHKRLSAPRLNLSSTRAVSAPTEPVGVAAPPSEASPPWLQGLRQLLAKTQDVGAEFAEEARKMHYGEAPERGIRGQATPEQVRELLDEGIEVMTLALPPQLKNPLH